MTNNNTSQNNKPRLEIEGAYRMNIPLLLLTFVLVCFGLIMLFSASMSKAYTETENPLFYVINQGQMTLVGIAMASALIFVPIKWFDRAVFLVVAYVLSIALVVYTFYFGAVFGGSRRWIEIGGRTFQTSEFVKVAIVFCIAGYRSLIIKKRKAGKLICKNPKWQGLFDGLIDIALPVFLILICMTFVLMQPHMSTFIIVMLISGICFLVSGIPVKSWFYGGLIVMVALVIMMSSFFVVAPPEQKDRIEQNFTHVFTRLNIFRAMNIEDDNLEQSVADDDEVYQTRQSMIAVGSGGITGVGFGNSRQKYLYLPEAHNDFVFAIACEELGFIGGVTIITLFLGFLIGGLSIAWKAKNTFSRILAVGFTSLITIQAFFNIGVAIGVIPPTGITLPFFSFGGSANLFFLIAVGLLLSISRSGVKRKSVKIIELSKDVGK